MALVEKAILGAGNTAPGADELPTSILKIAWPLVKGKVLKLLPGVQSNATAIMEGESNERDGNVPTLTATLSSILEPNITYSDLNDKGQIAFQFAWTMYQDELKEYRLHTENVRKLKEWVFESAVNSYKESCCKSDQSIKDWYRNLKEAVVSTTRMQRDIAIAQYQEALKPPKSKDLLKWIDN